MILNKQIKLLRKFLGNINSQRFGSKNQLTKIAKFSYLPLSWVVEILGDALFFWKRRGHRGIANPRRMLIIKVDELGDTLWSTLLLPAIKSRYPNSEIDYLVHPRSKLILEKNPHVANIFFWEDIFLRFLPGRGRGGPAGLRQVMKRNYQTLRALRQRKYDAVINARAYHPSSNVPWRKIGGALIAFDIAEQSFLADYWADYDLESEEWENYLNLLIPLGILGPKTDLMGEFYDCSGANPMAGVKNYAVVSPVTFDEEKKWGKRNWKEVISFIASEGISVALTGIPSQRGYLEQLASNFGNMVKVCAEMKISEFGALMKDAAFFIGIESFPAHLALALRKQSFFLVNSKVYYLKGKSPKKFALDARSMLPIISNAQFFDVTSASARDVKDPLATEVLSKLGIER